MQISLTVTGPASLIQKALTAIAAVSEPSPQPAHPIQESADSASSDPAGDTDVEAIRKVRPRCKGTWPYVQKIAASFKSGEELTIAEMATRTGEKIRKIHSIWNGLGRPLKSENVEPFFQWVPDTKPKRFTLSDAAKAEILK
jgi:hypothetical protein